MWKAPSSVHTGLDTALQNNKWIDAAFTMRLLADAMHYDLIKHQQLHAHCRVFMQRLHADIYDEICRCFELKYTKLFDPKEFEIDVVLGCMGMAYTRFIGDAGYVSSSYVNLSKGVGALWNISNSVWSPKADRENEKLSASVLAAVKNAFKYVSELPRAKLYDETAVYELLPVRSDRPYIYDTHNIRAYPAPLSASIKAVFSDCSFFEANIAVLNPTHRKTICSCFEVPRFASRFKN